MLADASIVALAAMLTLQTAAQNAAVPVDDPLPEETWTISGRVTDRESGRPLPRARVGLYSGLADPGRPPMRATLTDARGYYELAGLTAGVYSVLAQPPPYVTTHLPQAYGADAPFDGTQIVPSPPIRLKGQRLRDVDIALVRSGTIEGRVVNGDGDPLAGIAVAINRTDRRSAESVVRLTDDRGAFRHFGLSPGRYRICASAPESAAGSAQPLRRACYRDGNEAVDVGASAIEGLELRMTRGATATVSGVVLDAAGAAMEQAHLEMVEENGDRRTFPIERLSGGRFVIRGLERGSYRLTASRRPASPLERIVPELGAVTLRVEDDNEDVVVRMKAAVSVSGTVLFEDGAPPGAFARMLVYARGEALATLASPDGSVMLLQPSARVREDGTFQISGILGPSRLTLSGLPAGWVLRSISYGGRDVTDAAADFESSGPSRDVTVVLTSRVARVTGRVAAAGARPRLAVLITADRGRWTSRNAIVTAEIKDDGTFELPPVLPGAYHIVATGTMYAVLETGPALAAAIERLASQGTALVVAEGERRAVTVQVVGDR